MSGRRSRKAFRFLHMAVNGIWLGAVLSALFLVVAGSPEEPALYLAAFWLHDNIVIWAASAVLFTGLFFSLYTPWGLIRKWWVLGKWIGLVVLGLGIPFAATPVINALAAHSDLVLTTGELEGELASLDNRALAMLAAEAIVMLLLFALSTWRPTRETGLRWEEKRLVRPVLLTLAVLAVVSGILGSVVLGNARRAPLAPSPAIAGIDGLRNAEIDWLGAKIAVQVEVRGGRILTVRILEQPEGHYPELAALVVKKVEVEGDLEVDGISGATTSARGILVAASEALAERSAGGEQASLPYEPPASVRPGGEPEGQ